MVEGDVRTVSGEARQMLHLWGGDSRRFALTSLARTFTSERSDRRDDTDILGLKRSMPHSIFLPLILVTYICSTQEPQSI